MIMRFISSLTVWTLAATFSSFMVQPLAAQTAEQLEFIPSGGRTLLTNIVAGKPPADEIKSLLTAKRSREEWSSYLNAQGKAVPALQKLIDKERLTLADYLSF